MTQKFLILHLNLAGLDPFDMPPTDKKKNYTSYRKIKKAMSVVLEETLINVWYSSRARLISNKWIMLYTISMKMCGNYYMFSNIPCEFRDAFCLSFTDLSSWTPDRGPLSMVRGRSLNFEVGGIIDDDKHLLSHPLLFKSSGN